MDKVKQKVKVIEIVGQKLNPKAKYLFLLNVAAISMEDEDWFQQELSRLIGDNFTLLYTYMPINESMKVFEVLPKEES